MRDLDRGEKLKRKVEEENLDIVIAQLDVICSINSVVSNIINTDGKIDILHE